LYESYIYVFFSLSRFHGIYQQDDRDIRPARAAAGKEPAYSFMVRVRIPGGVTTPAQYIAMDDIADRFANGTIRLTTRQAIQFHGIVCFDSSFYFLFFLSPRIVQSLSNFFLIYRSKVF
jgi:sulfite reductase beta subunit-like hemoprotein